MVYQQDTILSQSLYTSVFILCVLRAIIEFTPPPPPPQHTHTYTHTQHVQATLGSGNLKLAVQLPDGEDLNEWIAVNSEQ